MMDKACQTDPVKDDNFLITTKPEDADKEINGRGKQGVSPMAQAIKIDALWKPLIRKFRAHIKHVTMHRLRCMGSIEEESEAKQGLKFGIALGVPQEMLDQERTQMALYMIVRSAKITSNRSLLPEFLIKLGSHGKALKQNYFKIYFENSSKKRLVFFCEPLIQFLWTIFRE